MSWSPRFESIALLTALVLVTAKPVAHSALEGGGEKPRLVLKYLVRCSRSIK